MARYVPERKKWFIYNGRVWEPDTGNLRAMELCKKLADDLAVYALSIQDEKRRTDYLDFVRHWQRRNYRETILKDAASVYLVSLSEFDKDPFLFNCLNGTLDLRTGAFRSHSPADMLSKKQTSSGSGPSEDIARLAGARVVNLSEPDKKMVLSAALVVHKI